MTHRSEIDSPNDWLMTHRMSHRKLKESLKLISIILQRNLWIFNDERILRLSWIGYYIVGMCPFQEKFMISVTGENSDVRYHRVQGSTYQNWPDQDRKIFRNLGPNRRVPKNWKCCTSLESTGKFENQCHTDQLGQDHEKVTFCRVLKMVQGSPLGQVLQSNVWTLNTKRCPPIVSPYLVGFFQPL